MATKSLIGKNPDSTDRYIYDFSNDENFLGAILITGPVNGAIRLSDGTTYDVSEYAIQCKPEHVGPLHHHLHKSLNSIDAPGVVDHECKDECGEESDL